MHIKLRNKTPLYFLTITGAILSICMESFSLPVTNQKTNQEGIYAESPLKSDFLKQKFLPPRSPSETQAPDRRFILPPKPSSSVIGPQPVDLQNTLKKIIKQSKIAQHHFGLVVYNTHTRQTEFSINSNRLFIPASLSKIISASAVLEYMDPAESFHTTFLTTQPISPDGTLKGDLYLKGHGDPSFVSETLWNLVNNLTRTNLRTVEGHLVLDDFWFQKPSNSIPIFTDRSYHTPLSALSFNWNAVNVYIRPGAQVGQPAQVHIDPQNSYIEVQNKTQTFTHLKKHTIKVSRIKSKNGKDIIIVRGKIPLRHTEIVVYRNISDPTKYTGYNTLEFLKRRDINIQKGLKVQKTPEEAQVIATMTSRTLSQLVKDMMKYSNNFITDMLVTQLSIYKNKESGNLKGGIHWVRKYLNELGVQKFSYHQPSGLSRKNKLSPNHILTVLKHDFLSPYSHEKMTTYPLANQDGTLKLRFNDIEHPSLIRAKTGRLTGVDGLAGYATSQKSGVTRIFVFIYNGSPRYQQTALKTFDNLATTLVNTK